MAATANGTAATAPTPTAPTPTAPAPTGLMAPYTFPHDKLSLQQSQAGKTPVVLVACGSFSPITYLHLRMFEMARDFIRKETKFEVCGAYLSPVSDDYKKKGLAPAPHRLAMCSSAVETSSWLMVDPFESLRCDAQGNPQYVPTADVLRHFDHEINTVLGGILDADGKRVKAKISLLAGADLIMSMSEPGLWSPADLDVILGEYGAFIIERTGTDMDEALASLRGYTKNIWVINQVIVNDVSSTKIRLFLKKALSVRYLIPDPVVEYIGQHSLFHSDGTEPAKSGASGTATAPEASSGPTPAAQPSTTS